MIEDQRVDLPDQMLRHAAEIKDIEGVWPETLRLLKHGAAATVERSRYLASLHEADNLIMRMLRGDESPTRDTLLKLRSILGSAEKGWKFRQHQCPKCRGPAEFFFMMCDPGPNRAHWDCPECGRTEWA